MTDRRRDAIEFISACTADELDAVLREARGDTTKPPPAHELAYPAAWIPAPRTYDRNSQ